jgi:thioredoxin 1
LSQKKTFNDTNFDQEVLQSEMPVIVDFSAPWCGPCEMIGPIIEQIAQNHSGKVKVGELNVDESQTTAMKFSVMSVPTIILFKNGQEVKRVVGYQSQRELEQEFGL